MTKVLNVFQVRVQKAHQLYHCISIPLARFSILEGQQVFDHFLNMSAVFAHRQMVSGRVIFHSIDVHKNNKCNESKLIGVFLRFTFTKFW